MAEKKLSLIERKTNLYNRLSKEIETCTFVMENPNYYTLSDVKNAIKLRPMFRAIQKLLDDIFNGEDE